MSDLGGTYLAEQGLLAALNQPRKKTEKVELGQQSLQFTMTEEDEDGNVVPADLSKFRVTKTEDKQHKRDEVVGETLALHHKEVRIGYSAPMDNFAKLQVKAEDRRKRHDAAKARFDARLQDVAEELERRVIASGVAIQEMLGEIDGTIGAIFAKLNDDDNLTEQPEHSYVLEMWDEIAQQCTKRTAAIGSFREDLERLEKERGDQVGDALRELAAEMVAVAYRLPPEIERIVEVEVHALNMTIIGNHRAHADLISRLSTKDVAVAVDSRSAWLLREAAWRQLRHDRALRTFDTTINSLRFVNPTNRKREFSLLRESQRALQAERESLLRQLHDCTVGALKDQRPLVSADVVAIAKSFDALRDRDAEEVEASFGRLRDVLEDSAVEARGVREDLRAELHKYAALASEGQLEQFVPQLRFSLEDEELDEYWRMAGALKPELKRAADLLESPRIIYAEELKSLRKIVDLLVECLPLNELLEQQGKGGERANIMSTLEQVRKAAKSDLPGLLPVLQSQASSLASVAGLPALQVEALELAATELGSVLDEYTTTQRKYEATMKKQKSGKQTDFAASLGIDTTQINMAGVRHAQRNIAMLVHATSLGDDLQKLLRDVQHRCGFQARANRLVNGVILDTCTAPLAARYAEGETLLNDVGSALTGQARVLHGGAIATCDFFRVAAIISETHIAKEDAIDEASMDEMWQLRNGQDPPGHRERLGRDPADTDDFEPVKPGLWEVFNNTVHQMREAPDQRSLQQLLELTRSQLDGIEQEYRDYHATSVSAAYRHPREAGTELRRFLRALCRHFSLLPNAIIANATSSSDPEVMLLHGIPQLAGQEPPAPPTSLDAEGGDDAQPPRVGLLDGYEDEAKLEDEELTGMASTTQDQNEGTGGDDEGEGGADAEAGSLDETPDAAAGEAEGDAEVEDTDSVEGEGETSADHKAEGESDGGDGEGEVGEAEAELDADVEADVEAESQAEEEEQEPTPDPWDAEDLVTLDTEAGLRFGVVHECDQVAKDLLEVLPESEEDADDEDQDDALAETADELAAIEGENEVVETADAEGVDANAEEGQEGVVDGPAEPAAEPAEPTEAGEEVGDGLEEGAEAETEPEKPWPPVAPLDPEGTPCIEELSLPADAVATSLNELRGEMLRVRDSESVARAQWAMSQCEDRQGALSDELEERLRLHWPRKGRIEVQQFQPRESELLAHEQRLARHVRAQRIRHRDKGTQMVALLEQARAHVEKHCIRIDTLQAQLPLQPNLAALQGMEGRAKAATAEFSREADRWQQRLAVMATQEPMRIVHAHEELVRACLQATFRLGGDYNPSECALVEKALEPEVETARADAKGREAQCEALHEEQAAAESRFERFAGRYKNVLKELCMREGLGQKFGAPRRNAQERLRTSVARSDNASQRIDEALNELKKLVSIGKDPAEAAKLREKVEKAKGRRGRKARAFLSLRVRRVLILLRTYLYRRATYLSFLKGGEDPPWIDQRLDDPDAAHDSQDGAVAVAVGDGADDGVAADDAVAADGETEDGSVGGAEEATGPVLAPEDAERPVPADDETDLLPNDPGDPEIEEQLTIKTFTQVLDDIDADCREETRALYVREGEEDQLGPSGVPDALQTFLVEQRGRAVVTQEAWCRKLREQAAQLEAVLCDAPATMLSDVTDRALERNLAARTAVNEALQQRRAGWEQRRERNRKALRPQLSSANCRAELEALVANEQARSAEVTGALTETRATLLTLLEAGATEFERRFRAILAPVGVLLDTTARPADLGWLPGDDDILPPRKGLKRLRLQQRKLQRVALARTADGLDPVEPRPLRLPQRRWGAVPGFGSLQVKRLIGPSESELAAEAAAKAEAEAAAAEAAAAAEQAKGKKGKKGKAPAAKAPEPETEVAGAGGGGGDEASGGDDGAITTLVTTSHRAFIKARDAAHAHFLEDFTKQVQDVAQEYDALLEAEATWTRSWESLVRSLRSDETQL